MSRTVRFEPLKPKFRPSDFLRILVIGGLGGLVYVNRADLERLGPTGPSSPDQPWIDSPKFMAQVPAGIVKFEGQGPTGAKVAVVENDRIVGESWVKDGKWTVSGKLFGTGGTAVHACVIGGQAKTSPDRHFNVTGHADKTLFVTVPAKGDTIKPGKVTLAGTGKPGDALVFFYNDVLVGKTTVTDSKKWSGTVNISEPKKGAQFKVFSKAESEMVVIPVGSGS